MNNEESTLVKASQFLLSLIIMGSIIFILFLASGNGATHSPSLDDVSFADSTIVFD